MLAGAALVALAAMSGPLGQWFAAALLLIFGPYAWRSQCARSRSFENFSWQLRARAPALVVVAAFVTLLFPLCVGSPPASRDHAIHYLQSAIFVEQLLEHGRLRGPSFALNTGFPVGDSYPVLGYALTSALHLLSFKWISLRASYALGLTAVWALHTWALFALGRRAAGGAQPQASSQQLHRAQWAGAAAALAFLLDPGAARQGGWNYTMFHGVWPQLLSTGLFLASLELGFRALARPRPRTTCAFAFAWAASIVAHPFGWITGAMALFGWPLILAFGSRADHENSGRPPFAPGAWRVLGIAAALTLAACAHAVVVFLASRGSMARVPVPWLSLGAFARQLFWGESFEATRALSAALMTLGLFAACLGRHGAGRAATLLSRATVVALCGMALVATREAITVLRLDLILPGLQNLQFPRFAFAMKGLGFVLVGVGVATLLRGMRSFDRLPSDERPASLRPPGLGRVIVGIALAPLLASALASPRAWAPRPVGATETFAETHAASADVALRAAFAAERSAGVEIGRVAFLREGMSGATYPLFAVVDAQREGGDALAVALDMHIPTVNFRHRVRERSPSALRAMGVTHLVFGPALGANDAALAEQLEPIADPHRRQLAAHGWTVARLLQGQVREVPWARVRSNHGRIRLRAPSPDPAHGFELEIDRIATDPAPASITVEIAVAPYRAWHLRDASGRAIETHTTTIAGGVPGLRAELEASSAAGRYTLVWSRTTSERFSGWLSLATWLLIGFAGISDRPKGVLAPRPARRWPTLSLRQTAILVGVLAMVLAALWVRQERKLVATWRAAELVPAPAGQRVVDLVDRTRLWVDPRDAVGCSGVEGRDANAGCDADTHGAYVDFLYRRPHLYRCLSLELQPGQARPVHALGHEDLRESVAFASGPRGTFLSAGDPRREDTSVPVGPAARRRLVLRPEGERPANQPLFWVRNANEQPARICVAAAAVVAEP